MLVVAAVLSPAAGAGAQSLDAPPAQSIVNLRVIEPGLVQQLTLKDGSRLYGHVESIADGSFVFRTVGGVTLTLTSADAIDLRVATGRVVQQEFQPRDPHGSRLMFAPTARSLRAGEGYVGVYEVMLPFAQVGITDRISFGGGTPLIIGSGVHPFWLTPKVQIVARDHAQIAAGVIHIAGLGESHDAGIAYGVTTVGTAESAATIGVGYAYSGHDHAPILMVGGDFRASRHVKWITENWIWSGGDGFVSGGVRYVGDRISVDFSLVKPLESFVVVPLVSFAWHFVKD
jgi:hypothetical protein